MRRKKMYRQVHLHQQNQVQLQILRCNIQSPLQMPKEDPPENNLHTQNVLLHEDAGQGRSLNSENDVRNRIV